jgi:ribulose-bisphosphate carboxylase large chain
MIRRANFISNIGGHYIMINALHTGWSTLQTLRDVTEELGLAIHANRTGYDAFTRMNEHCISTYLMTKLARLVGFDQLYIGNIDKIHDVKKELTTLRDCFIMDKVKEKEKMHILSQNWDGVKPMLPAASCRLDPTAINEMTSIFGKDIIMQFDSTIYSHPMGTIAGAKACRQAIDAILAGTSLEEYGMTHAELQAALNNGA